LNDIGRNSSLGYSKKIAKFLMRTFACRSTFLYEFTSQNTGMGLSQQRAQFILFSVVFTPSHVF
jgi:hypothetical protein